LSETEEEKVDVAKFFYEKDLKAPDGTRLYGAFFYAEPLFAGYKARQIARQIGLRGDLMSKVSNILRLLYRLFVK